MQRRTLQSKNVAFWALMGLALLLALLPARVTRAFTGFLQPASLVQQPLHDLAGRLREGASEAPAAEEALRQEIEALRLQVAHQHELLAQRDELLEQITRTRQDFPDGQSRIVVARVVSDDTDPRRDGCRISVGRRDGVDKGDWVVAGLRRGEKLDPAAGGRDPLLRRALIGVLTQVDPHVSYVRLISDSLFQAAVAAARPREDGGWEVVDENLVLMGVGQGRMRIAQSTADHFASGATTVLALVKPPLAGGGAAQLPVRMAVGRIVESKRRADSALHFDLVVEPWRSFDAVTSVFVIAAR